MRFPVAIAFSALLAPLSAQVTPPPAPPEVPALHASMARLVADLRLEGAGLAVLRDTGELHRSSHGAFTSDRVLPIASASKWLAVAAVLTLVDEGKLDLDAPLHRYVAEFDRADKRTVTLRQCLANTAGLAPRLNERLRGFDMAKFAAAAADAPLRDNPGMAFRYGGVGFQLAAVAAERVTGQSWHQLFAARIAMPLGMRDTKFGTLLPVGGEAGTAALPWVAGGAVSSLQDYAKFVQMLLGKGEFGGRRVLSAASVQAMLQDQVTAQVAVHPVGFDAEGVRYGLGTWLEPLPGGAWRASDPGAFGFTPWLDLDLGVGGVLAVRDRVGRVLERLKKVQEDVRAAVRSPVVAGTDSTVTLAHGGRDRRYQLHVPAGDPTAARPLVVVLHGGGGHGEQVAKNTGFAELADREGFAVVFPDGTGALKGRLLTWNSGNMAVYAEEHKVDDVGFLRAVVADVQRRVAIDPDRVFAVGHSNGGMMAHRLAREAADVFAGIAVVAGAMNWTEAAPDEPIAALLIHGTADGHVRYEGGAPRTAMGPAGNRTDASVQQAIDYYLERNGLRGYPESQVDGKVRIDTYGALRDGKPAPAPLRVVTIDGGGHAWPGGLEQARLLADTPYPWPATRAIWAFFAELRKVRSGQAPAAPR